jgi:hypothetical protein
MTKALDGSLVPVVITAPCGNLAAFDHKAGHSYRCLTCFCVIGSVGMPEQCRGDAT